MDGPIFTLKYLQEGIAKNQAEAELKSGDIVTAGKLTDAKPIFADQIWTPEFHDLNIIPLEIKFTARNCARLCSPSLSDTPPFIPNAFTWWDCVNRDISLSVTAHT